METSAGLYYAAFKTPKGGEKKEDAERKQQKKKNCNTVKGKIESIAEQNCV